MISGEKTTWENRPNVRGSGAVFGTGETAYSLDMVEVRGAYPEPTKWSWNEETAFDIMMTKGVMRVTVQDVGVFELRADRKGHEGAVQTLHIPAGTRYRYDIDPNDAVAQEAEWQEFSLLGMPPFDSNKYHVESEENN